MEIIHVVLGKANPARMNGVNKVVNELASQQAMAGETVALWGITKSSEHDYPGRPYDTRLFKARKNRFQLDPALIAALGKKKDRVIFHLHGGFIPAFNRLAIALHKRDIPFVLTPHGSYNTIALEKSKWRKKIYMALYEKTILKYARAIHCMGKSEIAGLQLLYPNNKSILIPYGFEPAAAPESAVRPDAGAGEFIIGFCGRIDIHTKGLDVLLHAFHRFIKDVPEARLWVIGDSPERQALQHLAMDMGMDDNVVFYGSKYNRDKTDLLVQLSAFVHPSRNEGLPTAVLEAASLGIPCIVTEATNTGDSIRRFDCGQVIDQPDAEELFVAMRALYRRIRQKGMEELSDNARRMISEAYNWKTILGHFHQLYVSA